jgi:cytochrome c oxidase assembly factor CtaG
MVQHLALQLVWAPLFLIGLQPWMAPRLLPEGPARALARRLTRPLPAFLLYNGMIWLWHLPALYNLALISHNWHIVEHLLFMGTAVIFWWPLVSASPELPRPAFGSQMVYVFANMVAMKALGMAISLQDEVIYTYYLEVPRVWGLTPLADQKIGGLLMWLPGGLLLWGGLGYVFAQWARRGTPLRGQTGVAAIDRRRAAASGAR